MLSLAYRLASRRSFADLRIIVSATASIVTKSAAVRGRPSIVCADPGTASEYRNARRGESGARGALSAATRDAGGTARVSVRCAPTGDGSSRAAQSEPTSAVTAPVRPFKARSLLRVASNNARRGGSVWE